MASTDNQWLLPIDLEKEFGISRSSQGKMRMASNSSKIPFKKLGRRIFYKRDEIDTWIDQHTIQ